jgi:RNA polymerase sigma-32 factor
LARDVNDGAGMINGTSSSDVQDGRRAGRGRASVLAMRIRSAALQAQRAKPQTATANTGAETGTASPNQSSIGTRAAGSTEASKKKRGDEEGRHEGWSGFRRYLKSVGTTRLLTPSEERSLALAYRDNEDSQAAARLVEANLRLVVKIAEEYGRPGDTLLDLIQEGNLGLVRAVQKFDPDRGVRLSSYAAWWIRAFILKYLLSNHRMVRVGTTLAQRRLFYRLRRERERLENAGVVAEARQIAEALQVKETQVVEMEMRLGSPEASLDAPVNEQSRTPQINFLADDAAARPDMQVENGEFHRRLKGSLERFVQSLHGRERDIALCRLLAEEPITLREIGLRYGVSRERARQIEANLKEKMKAFLKAELGDLETLRVAA